MVLRRSGSSKRILLLQRQGRVMAELLLSVSEGALTVVASSGLLPVSAELGLELETSGRILSVSDGGGALTSEVDSAVV